MKRACTDCGTVREVGARSAEVYRCHPCRRAAPEPLRIVTRPCQTDGCELTFDVPKRSRRKYCDPCVNDMVFEISSPRWQPCSVCGEVRKRSAKSRNPVTCQKCRSKQRAEREAYRLVERSGDIADELAPRRASAYAVNTTTAKGLGRQHQQAVAALKRAHIDGSPCDWCGRPMWLTRTRNWDYDPNGGRLSGILQGDHRIPRSMGGVGLPPDRLLHKLCNGQRSTGENDHLAWINHGNHCATTELVVRDA